MTYIKCLIKCLCGQDIESRLSPDFIPLKGTDSVKVSCPFCDLETVITKRDNIGVMCHSGTNDIAVFEDDGEKSRIYGNAN